MKSRRREVASREWSKPAQATTVDGQDHNTHREACTMAGEEITRAKQLDALNNALRAAEDLIYSLNFRVEAEVPMGLIGEASLSLCWWHHDTEKRRWRLTVANDALEHGQRRRDGQDLLGSRPAVRVRAVDHLAALVRQLRENTRVWNGEAEDATRRAWAFVDETK